MTAAELIEILFAWPSDTLVYVDRDDFPEYAPVVDVDNVIPRPGTTGSDYGLLYIGENPRE